MQHPSQTDLFDALDATWAPLALHTHDGWIIREGAGGGQRVSAATPLIDTQNHKISSAVDKMASLGQLPLFMIRNTNTALDTELQDLGYKVVDPVVILIAPTAELLKNPLHKMQTVHTLNTPDTNAKNIWAAGGIDQGRLNVMARVKGPKTILSADGMGVAFAATHNNIAMIHAVEVASNHRRKGVANAMMYKAFEWAKDQECTWIAILTVRANIPARTLYENLGMEKAAAYHYRLKALD
ncbi:MAG: GNAT family N-acetyltransferase [Amylibacter sp.]|nr:GNAT family N-acetyltransferase [Amylibacter sp.]